MPLSAHEFDVLDKHAKVRCARKLMGRYNVAIVLVRFGVVLKMIKKEVVGQRQVAIVILDEF
jgi:hypothetical protein